MNKCYLCNIASRRGSGPQRITNPEKLIIAEESQKALAEMLKSIIFIKLEKPTPE